MAENVLGVILAGGQARRMGHVDKAFIEVSGKPVIELVAERLRPQVTRLIINANGDPARFAALELPVAADSIKGFAGPLAGVLAAMEWAGRHAPDCRQIATIAVDTPFFPLNFVAAMVKKGNREKADIVCAASNGRNHPVAGLWPVRLARDLRAAMTGDGIRKVDLWTARHKLAVCEFATAGYDPFFNINRPDDIEQAETIMVKTRDPQT